MDGQYAAPSNISAHYSRSRRCYLTCLLPSGLYRRPWNFPRSCLSKEWLAGSTADQELRKQLTCLPSPCPEDISVFNFDALMIAYVKEGSKWAVLQKCTFIVIVSLALCKRSQRARVLALELANAIDEDAPKYPVVPNCLKSFFSLCQWK